MSAKISVRIVALLYLAVLVGAPVVLVLWHTVAGGLGPVWNAVTQPGFLHAFWLSIVIALIAVPLNTIFGVSCALVLVRGHFRGRGLVNTVIDLPLAVSPVVVGLALYIIYGRTSVLGSWFIAHGAPILFALPSMVLAAVFISLPFVVREVAPVLREIGTDAEQAAVTLGASPWQTFRRITFPAVRAAIGYGVVLTTARVLGEFGAVSIVSGRLSGQTETLTLYVQDRFESFDPTGYYTGAVVLALLALATLGSTGLFRPRGAA